MLSYENCPNNLPCMPSWPTIDGRPFPNSKPVYTMDSGNSPVDYIRAAPETEHQTVYGLGQEVLSYTGKPIRQWLDDPAEVEIAARLSMEARVGTAIPTLVAIGLLDALLEVESVLAWNEAEKHTGSKWKSKNSFYHDAKAISHLSRSQCGELTDAETLKSHRAHSVCRLLMSLAHELSQDTS